MFLTTMKTLMCDTITFNNIHKSIGPAIFRSLVYQTLTLRSHSTAPKLSDWIQKKVHFHTPNQSIGEKNY